MKKVLDGLIFLIIILLLGFLVFIYLVKNDSSSFSIKNIKLVEFDEEKNEIIVRVEKKNQIISNDFFCYAKSKNHSYKTKGRNNTCEFSLPIEEDYKIYIKNGYLKTKEISLSNYIENKLKFSFDEDEIYLIVGEDYELKYKDKYAFVKPSYTFISSNNDVASVEGNIIHANGNGEAVINIENGEKGLKVIVTDLVHKPVWEGQDKPRLTCHVYSEEEANLLDKLLDFQVSKAGNGTRAGAVAAARFLTLELPYRVPYFYENGRLDEKTAVNIVDGEGRYYHKGLYLSDNKFNDISSSFAGPAAWGCPLMNFEDDEDSGYYEGQIRGNGLDCSGFVSWTLKNGGFDPGDVGAGENEGIYQLTDTGDYTKLTPDLIYSGKIKAGDLFNYWGHISIIVGIDDEAFYVAESLQFYSFDGVTVKRYSKDYVTNVFEYVVLMDSYYKEDGNYTEMW